MFRIIDIFEVGHPSLSKSSTVHYPSFAKTDKLQWARRSKWGWVLEFSLVRTCPEICGHCLQRSRLKPLKWKELAESRLCSVDSYCAGVMQDERCKTPPQHKLKDYPPQPPSENFTKSQNSWSYLNIYDTVSHLSKSFFSPSVLRHWPPLHPLFLPPLSNT